MELARIIEAADLVGIDTPPADLQRFLRALDVIGRHDPLPIATVHAGTWTSGPEYSRGMLTLPDNGPSLAIDGDCGDQRASLIPSQDGPDQQADSGICSTCGHPEQACHGHAPIIVWVAYTSPSAFGWASTIAGATHQYRVRYGPEGDLATTRLKLDRALLGDPQGVAGEVFVHLQVMRDARPAATRLAETDRG